MRQKIISSSTRISAMVIFILIFCATSIQLYAGNPVNIRRACVNSNKDITICWVSYNNPCDSFKQYKIYARKTSADIFTLIDSIVSLSQGCYTHLKAADQGIAWEYFITYENDCDGLPGESSDTIQIDLIPPSISEPDSVSIDPFSGNILVGWPSNKTTDLSGYFLYQELGSITNLAGTTTDTFYTVVGLNTRDSSYTFKIATFDSCGNLSPSITTHSTIRLTSQLNDCEGTIDLTWSDYKGWPGVQKYDVLVSRNSGPFLSEKSVDGVTLNATIDQVVPGTDIKIFIRAFNSIDNAVSSSSNMVSYLLPGAKIPSVNYLSLVSALSNTACNINWSTDTLGEISFFRIRRGIDPVNMQQVADIPYKTGVVEYSYDDNDPKISFFSQVYYYQIEVYDNCKNPTGSFSNVSNTMLIKVLPAGLDNDTQYLIRWNKYQNFYQDVAYYYVYRGLELDGKYEWTVIGSSLPTDSQFIDLYPPAESGNTGICYKVIAFENPGNPFVSGSAKQAHSFFTCDLKDFKIFFPTAFNPVGVNRKWVPKGSFINYSKSTVTIANRWGQKITTITDLHKGWDGKDEDGKWMEPGMYIYYATITGVNKRKETFKGQFYFLR